jgi:predicted alpha/beta superfamily hydrolase
MTDPSPVQIPRTQTHLLRSKLVNDDFEILVLMPPEGVTGPLPVIYFTDASLGTFGMATSVVSLLQGGIEIPPVLLIGIGYPIGANAREFIRLRTRDFSPTADRGQETMMAQLMGFAKLESGGAPAFLEFLTTELRAWVKERFEVLDDTTLVGDSMGGLFATYTLFRQPEAFSRYVIGSPWLCWNPSVSERYEQEYAASHRDLNATVFLAAGADEAVLRPGFPAAMASIYCQADTAARTRRLGEALASRNYPSLRLTTRIFPEETHFTIPAILLAHGLRDVFAPK